MLYTGTLFPFKPISYSRTHNGFPPDLPLELREQILAYCTAKTLAYLSVTSKGITDEAEAMLYETISLHLSRESQLNACFRTLCDPASCRKARLIQTFAITFNYSESAQFADRTFIQLRIALKRMTSLKVLSVWAPEPLDFKWMGIGEILTCVPLLPLFWSCI
jgi:hypothetical protein